MEVFKGNYREIGFQQGEEYRKNGKVFDYVKIDGEIYRKQTKIFKDYYPQFLEELSGMAEGGGFDKDKVIYSNITGGKEWLKNLKRGCSIFSFKKDGHLFVGRNYDWFPLAKKSFQIYKTINKEANSFIAVSDMWVSPAYCRPSDYEYYAEDYINDKGLYIGLTYAHSNAFAFGCTPPQIMKLIAEKCSTVEDALYIFNKVPQTTPKNFFIADKRGDSVVVEHASGKNFEILKPTDNLLAHTNHFLNPKLIKLERVLEDTPLNDTFLRYYEIMMLINKYKENFKFSDIKKIMRIDNFYLFDPRDNNNNGDTIWTLSMDMTAKKYRAYFGDQKNPKEKILSF